MIALITLLATLTKKTTKQKRNLCYSGTVSAADEAKIKNLLVK